MLKYDLRKKAVSDMETAKTLYKWAVEALEKQAVRLFEVRQKCSTDTITTIENYINTLANSPKEFDRAFETFKIEVRGFSNEVTNIYRDYDSSFSDKVGIAGVAAGTGVAAFGPTAAMAVATTFGTASTGTAISTLGGAAATNAGLAWLGGGAVAAGGGGMAAGNAFLALAGPIGWGIGTASLASAGFLKRRRNQEIADKAEKQARKIKAATSEVKVKDLHVSKCADQTQMHSEKCLELCCLLRSKAPRNYVDFCYEHKQQLGALINHINSLSAMLKERI